MPRFFFHIRQGDTLQEDAAGTDIDEGETVRDEAVESARDLLAEGDLAGLDRREWVFEIVDESGETVLILPFAEAIEPDLPDAATEA